MFKIDQVVNLTTLSEATIYRMIRQGLFPAPVSIGKQRVAWREEDVIAFLKIGVSALQQARDEMFSLTKNCYLAGRPSLNISAVGVGKSNSRKRLVVTDDCSKTAVQAVGRGRGRPRKNDVANTNAQK